MLEKNRAVYAKAYKELEAKGYFDELAKILSRKPRTIGLASAAKKQIGNKRVAAEKPKRRAVADRCVKLSAKK